MTTTQTKATTQTPNDATKAQALANAATNSSAPPESKHHKEVTAPYLAKIATVDAKIAKLNPKDDAQAIWLAKKEKASIVLDWYKNDPIGGPSEAMIVEAVKVNAEFAKANAAAHDKEIAKDLRDARKAAAETAAAITLADCTVNARLKTDAEIVKTARQTIADAVADADAELVTGQFGARHSLKAAAKSMATGSAILRGQAGLLGGDLRSLTTKNGPAILAGIYAPTK